jgi:hypothetical protein
MPQVSTNSPKNQVTPIFVDGVDSAPQYFVAADDTYASVQAEAPSGALVILPGPDSTSASDELPSNGDYYAVADPKGELDEGHPCGVWGGGYPIQGTSGASPTSDIVLNVGYTEATFTFDSNVKAWIACICLGPED